MPRKRVKTNIVHIYVLHAARKTSPSLSWLSHKAFCTSTTTSNVRPWSSRDHPVIQQCHPEAITVTNALAALGGAQPVGAAGIKASNITGSLIVSPQGAFGLDADCLANCKLPANGAPGDGLDGLPADLRTLFGLST
ncbi:hypothetical protein WJX72_003446 [[Myrmecia] bisecta]|uniref:Uncharacterized protein n=1 Tax=[Myrmecia] bisecta TaxID=41462 RepID=A0AAW1PJQ1_9CHLO